MEELFSKIFGNALVDQHRDFAKTARSALLELNETSSASLSPLQMDFAIRSLAYSHHHFGFLFFSQAAKEWFANALLQQAGIDKDFTLCWMENTAYQLVEDMNVLGITTGEPDWGVLNKQFLTTFTKRILACNSDEFFWVGMQCFDQRLLSVTRVIAENCLEQLKEHGVTFAKNTVNKESSQHPSMRQVSSAFSECLEHLAVDPSALLAWRIQAFSEATENSASNSIEAAHRLSGLLCLFLPFRTADGSFLTRQAPLSAHQLWSMIETPASVQDNLDHELLQKWVSRGMDPFRLTNLQMLLFEAVKRKLVFSVNREKRGSLYGLTSCGLRILEPFREQLIQTLQPAIATGSALRFSAGSATYSNS